MTIRPAQQVVGSLKSLDGIASTGTGTIHSLGGAWEDFGVQLHGVGTTAATVKLEGAMVSSAEAGSTDVWQQIGSDIAWDSTAAPVLKRVSAARNSTGLVPVTHVRLRVSAFTTGTSTVADSLDGWIAVT